MVDDRAATYGGRIGNALIALLILLSACSKKAPDTAASSATTEKRPAPDDDEDPFRIWKAPLIPCSPRVCGGNYNNTATLRMESGQVIIANNGAINITLRGVTDRAGTVIGDKTFEVWVGSFGSGLHSIGRIKTDSEGNFGGTITTPNGRTYEFDRGDSWSGQFVLNDPGVRSEFVTGILIQ